MARKGHVFRKFITFWSWVIWVCNPSMLGLGVQKPPPNPKIPSPTSFSYLEKVPRKPPKMSENLPFLVGFPERVPFPDTLLPFPEDLFQEKVPFPDPFRTPFPKFVGHMRGVYYNRKGQLYTFFCTATWQCNRWYESLIFSILQVAFF